MNEPILMARVDSSSSGRILVLAPLVGTWTEHPHTGALVGPGSRIGFLSHLTRRFALVLPEGAAGRIALGLPRDRAVAVEYGQVLFELSAVEAVDGNALSADAGTLGRPPGAGLPEGAWAVVSPTDGVFYRRPSPASPPFVEEGARIRAGDPIGLVEVMKTFNQIAYGGPGLPEEAQVVEIRRNDAEEVRAGDILLVVR
jgi:biotin carboxyl carrier protein